MSGQEKEKERKEDKRNKEREEKRNINRGALREIFPYSNCFTIERNSKCKVGVGYMMPKDR